MGTNVTASTRVGKHSEMGRELEKMYIRLAALTHCHFFAGYKRNSRRGNTDMTADVCDEKKKRSRSGNTHTHSPMPRRSSKKTPARRRAKSHKKRSYRASPSGPCETILVNMAAVDPVKFDSLLSSLIPEERTFVRSLLHHPPLPTYTQSPLPTYTQSPPHAHAAPPPEHSLQQQSLQPSGPVEQIYDGTATIPDECPRCGQELQVWRALAPGAMMRNCPRCLWVLRLPYVETEN